MGKVDDYLKEYGFIIPSNELYGGWRGLYDYGPLGVLLKRNIRKKWEEFFILSRENAHLMEGTILGSEACWTASGHVQNFHDVLVDCYKCKRRYRQDHLVDEVCPGCGGKKWTTPREFNLIFRTVQDNLLLRPETAQGIFMNFKNLIRVTNAKLPFAIGQVGKAFRNEITLGNTIFRTLEFEQMECEWFVEPSGAEAQFQDCIDLINLFLIDELGIGREKVRADEIAEGERAHYSSRSVDFQFRYEFGWGELWGLANRGDFDLRSHQEHSGKSLECLGENGERYIAHVIEHSVGLNRLMYALVSSCLRDDGERLVLAIRPDLAPYGLAILPLTSGEVELAQGIYQSLLKKRKSILFLKKGSIGKRYRRCDAIGVPLCMTIDEGSLRDPQNPTITLRERDTREQRTMTLEEFSNGGWNNG